MVLGELATLFFIFPIQVVTVRKHVQQIPFCLMFPLNWGKNTAYEKLLMKNVLPVSSSI